MYVTHALINRAHLAAYAYTHAIHAYIHTSRADALGALRSTSKEGDTEALHDGTGISIRWRSSFDQVPVDRCHECVRRHQCASQCACVHVEYGLATDGMPSISECVCTLKLREHAHVLNITSMSTWSHPVWYSSKTSRASCQPVCVCVCVCVCVYQHVCMQTWSTCSHACTLRMHNHVEKALYQV